ncbi:hypothetical protein HKX48_004260 [Thoreauomyces humboldtii]|nr:hypothetical protein HKX48_004260 [Thoreauomyces humboldtii]
MDSVNYLQAAAITGAGAIACELVTTRSGRRPAIFQLLKPLTTILITLSLFAFPDHSPRLSLVAGYVFALIGDIALMYPGEGFFLAGLGSFFLAHVGFVIVFLESQSTFRPPLWTAGLVVYAIVFFTWLLPKTGALRIPVVVYGGVLTAMGLTAASAYENGGTEKTLLALVGAVVFVASDSALAVRQFAGEYRGSQLLVLSTYWTAIGLIAVSRWPTSVDRIGPLHVDL